MAELCTQADLENRLTIDVTAEPDAKVTYMIQEASAVIEAYCRREFEAAADISVTFDIVDRTSILRMVRAPITNVDSVTEDGTVLTEGTDFAVSSSGIGLWRLAGSTKHLSYWKQGIGSVTVQYDGGFATIPEPVVKATAAVVEQLFLMANQFAQSGGAKSEAIGDYRVDWGQPLNPELLIPPSHKAALARYRIYSP